jgi:hypothetical protein
VTLRDLFKTLSPAARTFEAVPILVEFSNPLDGEVSSPDSAGYDAIRRRPTPPTGRCVPGSWCCAARSRTSPAPWRTRQPPGTTSPLVAGGHCFAGRSSTDGIVPDLSGLDGILVADDRFATIRAGARLGQVYPALHAHGRTLPAGSRGTGHRRASLGTGGPGRLRLLAAIPIPGVTHLHYEVVR